MIILSILTAALLTALSYGFIHYLQLNGYRTLKALSNYSARKRRLILAVAALSSAFLALSLIEALSSLRIYLFAAFLAVFLVFSALIIMRSRKKAKTPLVFTNRIKRLFAVTSTLCLAAQLAVFMLYDIRVYTAFAYVSVFFYALIAALSAAAARPFEEWNNRRYIRRGAAKLASFDNLVRIGITGSYGKTSVKNILNEMLSRKYNTVVTEKNFNTPLGIVRTLNKIDQSANFFIAEMGARRKGDIAELCGMVKPGLGIITGIAEQHMETFKSLANIIDTKFELFEAVGPGGVCVINAHDERLAALPVLSDKRCITAGLSEDCHCRAHGISAGRDGSRFSISFSHKDRTGRLVSENIEVETGLVGLPAVVNITVAAAMAFYLGVDGGTVKDAVSALKPVPNRTEIIETGSMTIIDDTYNSNPVGAYAALEVLSLFKGRKAVVACGFAEQGKKLAESDRKLGAAIAGAADIAVLIGRGGRFIREGLISAGFSEANISSYGTLEEAKAAFGRIFKPGDVILFENDLPDNLE